MSGSQTRDGTEGRRLADAGWEKLPWFWFLLFLSYRCTQKCSYCYSFNQVGRDNVAEMDDRTFSRLLEWIPQVWRANNVKMNAIGFLGGEPLLRTDRIRQVMDAACRNTDGMQGFVYTNGDVVDTLHWDDLEDIQWISMNVTATAIDELSRRMKIIRERSNVIGQTVVATLDDHNLERALDLTRFGLDSGYRLRYYRNIYRGLDDEYRKGLLGKYHEICDLLEEYVARGCDVHTTFLFDTLIPLWDHESSPYHCGKRVATVFPDGSVGPCHQEPHNEVRNDIRAGSHEQHSMRRVPLRCRAAGHPRGMQGVRVKNRLPGGMPQRQTDTARQHIRQVGDV